MTINVTLSESRITVRFPVSTPGVGVPTGGAAGEVATKLSDDDYDVYWAAPGAASLSVSYAAGENINAGRVVVIDGNEAFYFQRTDPTHAGRAIGITLNAATTGNSVAVQFVGRVTDAGFSGLTDAVVWADNNGQLTTTRPTSGILQKVGIGLGSNRVLIDPSIQITMI